MELVTLDEVGDAARRIADTVSQTPVVTGPKGPRKLWLKAESLQPSGAFKLRGATNALVRLDPQRRAAGVVTHSSGNHGWALAYAARQLQLRCAVVVPHGAAEGKVAAIRAAGAEIVPVPPADRAVTAERLAVERGATLIPPFDHPDIIAGQATVGLEIIEQCPELAVVVVPVGGGGLASGVVTAVRALRPEVTVLGAEPELAADAAESLSAGRLIPWSPESTARTIADGLRTALSELTFAHLQARLDGIVTVREDEIRLAMRSLVSESRLVAEPSGAVATAAVLGGHTPPGCTVTVVSGGNVSLSLLSEVLS